MKRAAPTPDEKRRLAVWAKVRVVCAALEGVEERASFGNPAFRTGTRKSPFVVLDHYRGESCLWVRVDPGRRRDLLADPRFFPAPYGRREQALCRSLRRIGASEIKPLIKWRYLYVY